LELGRGKGILLKVHIFLICKPQSSGLNTCTLVFQHVRFTKSHKNQIYPVLTANRGYQKNQIYPDLTANRGYQKNQIYTLFLSITAVLHLFFKGSNTCLEKLPGFSLVLSRKTTPPCNGDSLKFFEMPGSPGGSLNLIPFSFGFFPNTSTQWFGSLMLKKKTVFKYPEPAVLLF